MDVLYILHNNDGFENSGKIGGHVAHAIGVIEAFHDLGHRVSVLTTSDAPYMLKNGIEIVKKTHYVSRVPKVRGLLNQWFGVSSIIETVKYKKNDLVYIRWPHNVFLYRLRKEFPDLHIVLECNTAYGMNSERNKNVFSLKKKWGERQNIQNASLISAVSDTVRNFLLSNYRKLPEDKIISNPNGVDPEKFRKIDDPTVREKYAIPGNMPVIGFTGYFAEWHRIDLLIEAVQSCTRDVRLLLIGKGPAAIEEQLRKLASTKNQERIIFTGPVSYDDIPRFLSACDILAVPQDDIQNHRSPIKLFEYMAMEKPVMVSKVGQLAQVINDGENGLVFENNVKDLTSKLSILMDDPALCSRLAERARTDVMKRYTWKANVQRIIDALEITQKEELER